jgi:hypothetical protein
VTSISSNPFRLDFLARPAGQGKTKPEPCFADTWKLVELDSLKKVIFKLQFVLYLNYLI